MKKVLRVLALLLASFLLLYFVQSLLQAKWVENSTGARETTNTIGFYAEPDHSLDVLLLGSSNIFYGTSPLKLYEEYGFTSYVRGSANQPIMLSYYTLLDCLRSQTPKVLVLEMESMLDEFDPVGVEYSARRALDYMQLSSIKLSAIRDLPIDGSDQTRISYVFPLLRYHERWKELDETDVKYFLMERQNHLKGQYAGTTIYRFQWPENFMAPSADISDVPEQNTDYFERLAQLCQEKEIALVLISTPGGTWNMAKHNAVQKCADEYGLFYLDYNLPELIETAGIIDTEDFHYNQWHLRVTGADKLSSHLGAFLKAHYSLPDHRGDNRYAQWDADLAQYNALKAEKIPVASLADPELDDAVNAPEGIQITWESVANARAYVVFRRVPGGDWVTLGQSKTTDYLDETAEPGTEYTYTVKAVAGSTVSYCDPNGLTVTRLETPQITAP